MAQGVFTGVKAVQRSRGDEYLLEVSGTLAGQGAGATIVAEDIHDGFNRSIALFDVRAEGGGSDAATSYPFSAERVVRRGQYTQVSINPGQDNSVVVDVEEG